MTRATKLVAITLLALATLTLIAQTDRNAATVGPAFVAFESGHVRPLALSPDGKSLFAVNTPNGTLEIFDLTSSSPNVKRVPVGLEPVAVAARSNTEVWVVNHLSDSVSVVTLTGTPHVVRTLLVGDEPRDIVFAGTPQRAFITTARRGQHRTDLSISRVPGAGDPLFTTPGIPRADVWIFDPANLENSLGGTPLKILSVFTDTPRALAVSPDKNTVYAAGFHSGNQTSVVPQDRVCAGFKLEPCTLPDGTISPGGNPGPSTNAARQPAPEVGLIVKFNNQTGHWEDELRRNWDGSVRFTLPDLDVFAIDANTLDQRSAYAHVGTTLFNMVTNPATGKLYVSNTEAINQVRFEGPGIFGGSTVQGHLAESRITVISGPTVTPRHLNKHINYNALAGSPAFDPTARNNSLATPNDMAVTADGKTLYVAAFGSSKVGVFDTARLEDNTFNPTTASANYIPVSGGGVSGLALDEPRGLLYVMTRFDNAVKVVDLKTKTELAGFTLPNPEPASVVDGRPMLYDATRFSGNGEATCSSCHIFGDMDDLAWDLGNPDDAVTKSPIPIVLGPIIPILIAAGISSGTPLNGSGAPEDFHPMKGPFTTQTLRGMKFSGAMHWRGDRAVGPLGTDPFDSTVSFKNFQGAFQGLIGSPDRPTAADMQRFADFQLQVLPPPNPIRNLDNSLTPAQQRGADFYSGARPSDILNCNGCHELNPAKGFFGTGMSQSFEALPQIVKIPHLRNQYTKVGMFGNPRTGFFDQPGTPQMGDQIRGYGFLGDGTSDTLFRFFTSIAFRQTSFSGFTSDAARRDMEQFMLAFDSDLAPIVGQQVTLTKDNGLSANPRIDLLMRRAAAPLTSRALDGVTVECDLVAAVVRNGKIETYLYNPATNQFGTLSDSALRALALTPGQEVTYTAATPGSGRRYIGVELMRDRRR